MTSRQLEIFFLLSDNLNFGKTAEDLFLAQSSVSREIQALEKELGFHLFKRSLKSVQLTEKGEDFKKSIAPLINSIQTEISRIKNKPARYKQKLRMGFFHISGLKNIPEAVGVFHQRYPLILPEIHQGNLDQLSKMFHSGQLDLIFAVRSIMTPKATDKVKDIYTGKFCATLPINNPLSTRTSLRLHELDGYDILQLDSSSSSVCFKPFANEVLLNCPNSMFISCSSTDVQEFYLQAGMGIALSTEYSFKPNSAFKQIPIESKYIQSLQTNYAVMWHSEPADNHIEDFICILEEILNPQ